MIEIDPAKVDNLAGLTLVQLARLVKAIVTELRAGEKFAPGIMVELGNASALMLRTVKEQDNAGQRTTASTPGDIGSGAGDSATDPARPGLPVGNARAVENKRPARKGAGLRKGGKPTDPS